MPRTIAASLVDCVWEPGRIVTYTITSTLLPNSTEDYIINNLDIWQ